MQKNCAYCGQPFEAKGRGRFCSDSHRVMGFRQQKGLPPTPFKQGPLTLETAQVYETKIAQLQQQIAFYEEQTRGLDAHIKKSNTLLLHYYQDVKLIPQNRQLLKSMLAAFDLV